MKFVDATATPVQSCFVALALFLSYVFAILPLEAASLKAFVAAE